MTRTAPGACALLALVACSALFATVSAATPAQYNQDFAMHMVYMSAAAYCPQATVANWTCPACKIPGVNVTYVAEYTPLNLQAYVSMNQKTNAIVVAFRGTVATSIKNWIVDLEASHSSTTYPHCSTCEVESGFYTAHEALKEQIVPAVHLLKRLYPSSPLYITGHSLGAAMAVLCAAHMQTQEGLDVNEVYTFGLPRVGNLAFSKWFNGVLPQAVHVTHYHDIVPHLPPESFGYHHVPTEVWYTVETGLTYTVCDGTGEDASCADSVHFYDYSVEDHFYYLDIRICSCEALPPPPMALKLIA